MNTVVVAIRVANLRDIELGKQEHDAILMKKKMQPLTIYIAFYQIIHDGISAITHVANILSYARKQSGNALEKKKWIITFNELRAINPIYYDPKIGAHVQGHEFTNLELMLNAHNLKEALCAGSKTFSWCSSCVVSPLAHLWYSGTSFTL